MTLVIGVDPHKQTHTAVAVRSGSGELVDERTAAARPAGYRELIEWAQAIEAGQVWALEDVRGVSRGLERFLLARGERVVRVPPKLMAGVRKSARGFGKSDAIDALAIARAALSHPELPIAVQDDAARDVRLLLDHREALVRQRSEAQDRLRWLLHQIEPDLRIPAGALDRKVWLERVARRLARTEQAAQVRVARDLVRRCRALTRDANDLEREIALLVAAYAPQLLELKGCGVLVAAKIIGETGGIGRFASDAQFACLAGVAPIDTSSGQQRRHRLSRHGNRQLNSALHKIAIVQGRWDPRARTYLERKQKEGKSRREALRALKRHLARVVFRLLRTTPGRSPANDQGARRKGARAGTGLRVRSWCSCPPERSPQGCNARRAESHDRKVKAAAAAEPPKLARTAGAAADPPGHFTEEATSAMRLLCRPRSAMRLLCRPRDLRSATTTTRRKTGRCRFRYVRALAMHGRSD